MLPAVMLVKAEIDLNKRPPFRPLRFADQMHARFLGRAVRLARVALDARTHNVLPRRGAAPIARDHVAEVVLVADDAIRAAQRALWDVLRVVGEPGGSAATAAILSGRYRPQSGERVGILVSGGNTVAVDFDRS